MYPPTHSPCEVLSALHFESLVFSLSIQEDSRDAIPRRKMSGIEKDEVEGALS